MTSMYRKGYEFERKVAAQLTEDGYYVVQSRGSHGIADLVAVKPGQVLMLQLKASPAAPRHDEWNALYTAAVRAGAVPVWVCRPAPGKVHMLRITGPHGPRKQLWPSVPFTADEAGEAAP